MHKTIIHTVRDESKHTKKDVEDFIGLINSGYEVIMECTFKNEHYFIMMKHLHEESGELAN